MNEGENIKHSKKRELQKSFPKNYNHLQRFRYLNDLFHYPPVKGFLQTIDDFFQNPFTQTPFRINLEDNGQKFVVTAELPGIKREQIQIGIFRNHATISIENKIESIESNKDTGTFKRSASNRLETRTVYFPKPVLDHKAKAVYQDGLLTITLPIDKGHTLQIE